MNIYLITNSENDKCYIGYTESSLSERFKWHVTDMKRKSKAYLHNAMRKYGVDKFSIIRVWSGCISLADLRELEKYYIKSFKTKWPDRYNLTDGGEGITSEFMKALWKDPEYREKMRNRPKSSTCFKSGYNSPRKGGHREDISFEVRQKMRKNAIQRNKEFGNPRQGVMISQETKDKISKANRGRVAWNKGLRKNVPNPEIAQ